MFGEAISFQLEINPKYNNHLIYDDEAQLALIATNLEL